MPSTRMMMASPSQARRKEFSLACRCRSFSSVDPFPTTPPTVDTASCCCWKMDALRAGPRRTTGDGGSSTLVSWTLLPLCRVPARRGGRNTEGMGGLPLPQLLRVDADHGPPLPGLPVPHTEGMGACRCHRVDADHGHRVDADHGGDGGPAAAQLLRVDADHGPPLPGLPLPHTEGMGGLPLPGIGVSAHCSR